MFSVASETAKVLSTLPALLSESRIKASYAKHQDITKVITYNGKEFVYNPLVPVEGLRIDAAVVADSGDLRNTVKSLNAIAKVLKTYETSPEFERALGGKTPDEYLRNLLADINVSTTERISSEQKKAKEIDSGKIDTWRGATPRESVMPQSGVSSLSPEENSDINTQIAALQKRQKELEATARKYGATEEDIANTGPRR